MSSSYKIAPVQTYVAPEDRDSAWWITRKLYACRVPNIQTMSPDYIKYFGMPESGDEDINKQMREELIDLRIPIGTMAEMYDEGVQISIPVQNTTKEIYERVHEHLSAWKSSMESSLHPGRVPVDDLLKLDQFASALFPYAKRFFDADFVESTFARKLGGILRINRDSFLTKQEKVAKHNEQNNKEKTEKHKSFAAVFSPHKHQGGSRWK